MFDHNILPIRLKSDEHQSQTVSYSSWIDFEHL